MAVKTANRRRAVEYGHTKLFQRPEQKELYEAICVAGSADINVLMELKQVRKLVRHSGGDNSVKAMKARLRGRVVALKNRLAQRGLDWIE